VRIIGATIAIISAIRVIHDNTIVTKTIAADIAKKAQNKVPKRILVILLAELLFKELEMYSERPIDNA
jgi:hypothetical protein